MKVAKPTIEEELTEFLTDRARGKNPQKAEEYEAIIDLLTAYLDGYAYESLSPPESEFWRSHWEEDEEANSFCRTFGPEKILPATYPFLDWFVIRKVAGPAWITEATGPVVSDLAEWLGSRGYAIEEDVADARSRAGEASRDLPRADRLGALLYEETEKEPAGPILEDRDLESELITISRLERGSIWFETEDGEVIGPVRVPPKASELAEVGWGITAAHLVRTSDGWHVAEIGNVYPAL
ncbi:MAG TPA: hypothetical protein VEQ37_12510 [Actinomycetota bacterium]|nr:hypothetical protein [Actinomycetota bacterium]